MKSSLHIDFVANETKIYFSVKCMGLDISETDGSGVRMGQVFLDTKAENMDE